MFALAKTQTISGEINIQSGSLETQKTTMDFEGDDRKGDLRTHVELLEEYNRQLDSIQQLQNKIKQNKEMGVENVNTDQNYLNFVNN